MNFKEYFGFTKGQYKGLILLLSINLVLVLYYVFSNVFYKNQEPHDFSLLISRLDSLEAQAENPKDSLFLFNPNTTSQDAFELLGLNSTIAQRIVNYRNKGGQFRESADLLKIYGMDTAWFERVESFVYVPQKRKKTRTSVKEINPKKFNPNTVQKSDLEAMNLRSQLISSWLKYLESGGQFRSCEDLKKLYVIEESELNTLIPFCEIIEKKEPKKLVELNSTDSLALISIRGVGPAFAHRILEYRSRLGGFASKYQLKEVYGLDSIRFAQMESQVILDEVSLTQLEVNTSEFKFLLRHPYLSYEQVKSIVNFREKLGPIQNMTELLELEGFTEKDTLRLRPYLSFKNN